MASSIKLELTISGQTGKTPIEPFVQTYELSGQDAAVGPKEIKVPAAASAASIPTCLDDMATQNLLLILSDKDVTYQINGDGINRTIKAGGFAVHPGGPVVTTLAFGGNGSTDASVTVFQLGIAGTSPSGVGGALYRQQFSATALQTTFNLTERPAQPTRVLVFIEGVLADFTDYSVSGTVLTWSGAGLSNGDRVQVVF